MANVASKDVEIMVHTTAGGGDARYRVLAQSYLGFEPATSHLINDSKEAFASEVGSLDNTESHPQQLQIPALSTQERSSAASYRPEDEEDEDVSTGKRTASYSDFIEDLRLPRSIKSPRLSFNSVFDNIDSPVFRGLGQAARARESANSWRPSVISDSQPDHDQAKTEFVSPEKILELYLPRREEPSSDSGVRESDISGSRELVPDSFESSFIHSSPSPDKLQKKVTPHSLTRISVMESKGKMRERTFDSKNLAVTLGKITNTPRLNSAEPQPNELTDMSKLTSEEPQPSDTTNRSTLESKEPQPREIINKSKLFSEESQPSEITNGSTSESQELPSSIPKRQRVIRSSSSRDVELPTSAPSSSQVINIAAPASVNSQAPSQWANALKIHPSPPETSTRDIQPEEFITNAMHKLASKMPVDHIYCPVEAVRDLRETERGFWIVQCQSWGEGLRSRCWNCLGNFIGTNRLGWGVSAERPKDHSTIRINCWGITVKYIYLVLYVASERKVKGTGACWKGGDCSTIIKMA